MSSTLISSTRDVVWPPTDTVSVLGSSSTRIPSTYTCGASEPRKLDAPRISRRDAVPIVPELASTTRPGTRPVSSSLSARTGNSRRNESTSITVTAAPSSDTARGPVSSATLSSWDWAGETETHAMSASNAERRMRTIERACNPGVKLKRARRPAFHKWTV